MNGQSPLLSALLFYKKEAIASFRIVLRKKAMAFYMAVAVRLYFPGVFTLVAWMK